MSGRSFNIGVPLPVFIETDEQARDLLHLCLRKLDEEPDFIGFDTETHGKKLPLKVGNREPLDWMSDTVVYWSLAFRYRGEASRYCLPGEYLQYFAPLLENPKAWLACWNAKYDAHVSWNSGIHIWNAQVVDGLVLAGLHDENRRIRSLKTCAPDWCGLAMTKYKDLFPAKDKNGRKIEEFEYSLVDLVEQGFRDQVSDYASYDAYCHLMVVEWLRDRLMEQLIGPGYSLWDYYLSMERAITEVLWRMERRGMYVDIEYLKAQIPCIDKEILAIEKEINNLASAPINLNSTQQLAKFFFGDKEDGGLGLKPAKLTEGNKPSVDASVLELLAESGVTIGEKIVRHRSISKTKSTYLQLLINLAQHYADGRIHPNFNQLGAVTGRFSTDVPNCFDDKTEVLSSVGWVRADKLTVDHKVAQWEPGQGTISFVATERVVHEAYKGPMVSLQNQHIDLVLTPDHRCPLVNRLGHLHVALAENYWEDCKQPHAGIYSGPGSKGLSDDFIRLLVAVQAAGSWVTNTRDLRLDMKFHKRRKATRLRRLLENVGAKFTYSERPNKKGRVFRFNIVGALVKKLFAILSVGREFGPWLLRFSQQQLQVFINELHHWDGCFKLRSMYSSSVRVNADWAQIAITLCGQRAKIRQYMPKSGRVNYQVDYVKRGYSWTTNIQKTTEASPGVVHCLTVPSGFVVVRRNGKVCITGQSQNMPRADTDEFGIRKAFRAPPGYKLLVLDYEQLEMRLMAHQSGDEVMIGAINEGKDLHSFTVSRMVPGVTYEEVAAAKKEKKENLSDRQKWLLLLRQDNKCIGFGILYGAGPARVAQGIEIPEADVEKRIARLAREEETSSAIDRKKGRTLSGRVARLIKDNPLLSPEKGIVLAARQSIAAEKIQAYFDTFPGVKQYIENTHAVCLENMEWTESWNGEERRPRSRPLDRNNQPVEDGQQYDWDVGREDALSWRPGQTQALTRTGHEKKFGYVQTLCGRLRRLEDINHSNYRYKAEAQRMAVNVTIQGAAADLTKGAMLRIESSPELNNLGVELLNQVHDELILQVPEGNAEAALPIVLECMEHPFKKGVNPLRVRIPAEGKVADAWSEK